MLPIGVGSVYVFVLASTVAVETMAVHVVPKSTSSCALQRNPQPGGRRTMMTGLVKYDAMLLAVAEVAAVDEIKDISDKAVSMRLYARQSKNHELECQMADIQGRATIRLGELSAALETAKPGVRAANSTILSPSGGTQLNKADALKAAGISRSTANRAEQLAPNSGYTTISVAVPTKVLIQALGDAMQVSWVENKKCL